ncbi:helix-turn-helix transcriptional regulator [Nocardia cyriacigeorgica]|nr:helix-turn-helix transcriptional regulator [Nocardia cyriacigeorgica]
MRAIDGRPVWTTADAMRKSLEASGIGIEEMADRLGVHRTTLGAWINGRKLPRKPTLIAWSQITDVPLGWLENPEHWQHHHPLPKEAFRQIDQESRRRPARKTADDPAGQTATTGNDH